MSRQLILHAQGLESLPENAQTWYKARLHHKLLRLGLGTTETVNRVIRQLDRKNGLEKQLKKKNDSSQHQQHAASSILLQAHHPLNPHEYARILLCRTNHGVGTLTSLTAVTSA